MAGGLAPALPAPVDLDRHTFKCIGTFQGHTKPVWALAVSGNLLFSGSDETIKVVLPHVTKTVKVVSPHVIKTIKVGSPHVIEMSAWF